MNSLREAVAAHTPGPWVLRADNEGCTAVVSTNRDAVDRGYRSANVCRVWHTRTNATFKATGDANAALIAAAPDLYAALLNIANGDGYYGEQAREYKQIARAAIAKVKGGAI